MTNINTIDKKTLEAQYKEVLDGAVEACLWSTVPLSDDMGDQLTEFADEYEISSEEMTKLRGTLSYFISDWFKENYELISKVVSETYSWGHVGHDFWLTSQGHGAGFWDRGFEEAGDDLTDSVSGHSDIVGLYLNEEATHVHVDPYNVQDFNDKLFK